MKKNTASQFLSIAMINATTGAALTGATVAVRRNLDGVDAAATGSVTEPNSDGKYLLALSQADTNGDNCSYYFTATNAVPVHLNVHTAIDANLTAAGVDAILDEVVESSYTMRQLLKVMAAALAGKVSGGGTTTVTFKGVDGSTSRIVATVDSDGNRSSVTLTTT